MKTFKVLSDTKKANHSVYQDFCQAENEAEALAISKADAKKYGLPENTEFTITHSPQHDFLFN